MNKKDKEDNIKKYKMHKKNYIINFNKKISKTKLKIALIGFCIIVFSLIGLGVSIKYVCSSVTKIVSNSKEKEKFERYILPVLMFDPVPFDKPSDANEFSLLQTAIWASFMNNGKDKYIKEDYSSFVVPANDVDVSLSNLYGKNMVIKHQTFGDGYMNSYIFNEELQMYIIPILDHVGIYKPEIEEICRDGDIYTLTVGYIRPDDIWQMYMNEKKIKSQPEKYMEYILKKIGDTYNILSIRDSNFKSIKDKIKDK